jgi:hypothetical protein
MVTNLPEQGAAVVTSQPQSQDEQFRDAAGEDCRLRRWLVHFRSGSEWYAVGEFLALDADAAVVQAIETFGEAVGYRAEEIPWDAAPLNRRR